MTIFDDAPEIFSCSVNGVIDQCEENLVRVRALGSIWTAQLHTSCSDVYVQVGQAVTVIGRVGIQLIIVTHDYQA